MHKALDPMHLPRHHVLSALTGVPGMRMLRALVAGERDPLKLADLKNGRIVASKEEIAKSLQGNWRERKAT